LVRVRTRKGIDKAEAAWDAQLTFTGEDRKKKRFETPNVGRQIKGDSAGGSKKKMGKAA